MLQASSVLRPAVRGVPFLSQDSGARQPVPCLSYARQPTGCLAQRHYSKPPTNRHILQTPSAVATDESRVTFRETTAEPPSTPLHRDRSHETDFVIIGSGIGGLCCAALLAKYGYKVTVCESHYLMGGAAHSFEVKGFSFDAGPSFFAGLSGPKGTSSNPLKQVLDAVDESVECVTYDRWITYTPEGSFETICDQQQYARMIQERGGEEALRQWRALETEMAPLQQGAALLPAAAIRGDLGVVLTAARLGPGLIKMGLMASQLTAPLSEVVDKVVTNPWLRHFMDLECFVLSGMTAKDTICAEMAFMFMERNSGKSTIDYPVGGSRAIIDALVCGLEKHGGRVLTRAHVDEIVMEDGRAVGVRLQPRGSKGPHGEVIRGRKGVVSNASVWDTQKMLRPEHSPKQWRRDANATPQTGSFVHLHVGFSTEGLPDDLEAHHLIVNQWDDIDAPQNVCIASIPTVFNPLLAPEGKGVVHAYTAGNEPYSIWDGMDRNSEEYQKLKDERSQVLWQALERVIPDIRERAELVMTGTPLTHERFLRRHRGTYGPAISASDGTFPGPKTPIPGLYRCGDSCQPGIGVPAAAASGMITANTLVPVWSHLKLLSALAL